jgi:hypothetical protein
VQAGELVVRRGGRAALYLAIAAIGNLVWEALQLPLYTVWSTGTTRQIFVAVTHCTGGDVLIATAMLLAGALLARLRGWRLFGSRMILATVVLGVAYTIFSEWLNVEVWRSWLTARRCRCCPWLGTGLAPVLQWLIVPGLAFAISGRFSRPSGGRRSN